MEINDSGSPDCLGEIQKRYCKYCSEVCIGTALCVLLVMDDIIHSGLLNDRKVDRNE